MNTSGLSLPDEAALCRFLTPSGEPHLGWLDRPNPHIQEPAAVVDLTRVSEGALTTVAQALTYTSWHSYYTASPYVPLSDFAALVVLAQPAHLGIPGPAWDDFAPMLSLAVPDSFVLPLDAVTLLAPIDAQEVWIAGGSNERGPVAGGAEGIRLQEAERPTPFSGGDARPIVGPGQAIRIPPGSRRIIPCPALALLLDALGGIAGYTLGNHVHMPDIDGGGSPDLPRAAILDGACALGPWVVPAEYMGDPYRLRVSCRISRGGVLLWQGDAGTAGLHPRLGDLVAQLTHARNFPDGAYLLIGIPLAPPDSAGLQAGDFVEVAIEGLGTLRNPVT